MKVGFASLFGRPNAGKSTLINRLIGAKIAIVSDSPQTTRTRILGVKHIVGETNGQIVFLDTPGIHRPLHRMNVRMVDMAVSTISQVDVLVMVLDASSPTGSGDRFVLDLVSRAKVPVVLALNKIDLMVKHRLLPIIDRYRASRPFAGIVPISALTGDGVPELVKVVLEQLPEGEPLYPDDHTRAELPFSTAVVVDQFEEVNEQGVLRVFCSIVLDRKSHKPIVVGRAGALVKTIGTEARHDLEQFFGTRVFLDLHVRVREGWRENPRLLNELGLKG